MNQTIISALAQAVLTTKAAPIRSKTDNTCPLSVVHAVEYDLLYSRAMRLARSLMESITPDTPSSGSDAPASSRLSLQVRLERDDSMPAFGAFLRCEAQHDQSPVIYLNVEACMCIDDESTEEIKRNIITTLMHEFGHVLESYFRLPDNEDAIDKAIEDWQQILTASAHAYADAGPDGGSGTNTRALIVNHPPRTCSITLTEKQWLCIEASLNTHPSNENPHGPGWSSPDLEDAVTHFNKALRQQLHPANAPAHASIAVRDIIEKWNTEATLQEESASDCEGNGITCSMSYHREQIALIYRKCANELFFRVTTKPESAAQNAQDEGQPEKGAMFPDVPLHRLVRLCRRHKPSGRDFRLIPQRVCWSGDTIDVCSVCGMDVYDSEWPKHHSEELLEMVEPNAEVRRGAKDADLD